MEVTVPCPICKSFNVCDCGRAFTAFFKILDAVGTRVLREQASSRVEHIPVASAGVDKLNIYFPEPLTTEFVLKRSKQLGFLTEKTYLKERTPFLKISDGDSFVLLKPGMERKHIVKMVSNPNKFDSWGQYMGFIERLLSPQIVERAVINRLDLNLDFSCNFMDLIQSLDVKNKRSALSFKDESGERTGLIIGKGKENIEIYDKAKQAKLDIPRTRVEIRLAGRKLPTRQIAYLPTILRSKDLFEPLQGLNLIFSGKTLSETQVARLTEFKSLLKREGFYAAKKCMNQDRNFDRNFSSVVQVKYWEVQPSQLFKDGIKDFFGKNSDAFERPKLKILH